MSFTNILQAKYNQQLSSQPNRQSNPIYRINRGLKKGKFQCNKENDPYLENKHRPIQNQQEKNLSFGSLSKAKGSSLFSDSKQKIGQRTIYSECFQRKNSSDKNNIKDGSIKRKLNFDQNRKEASNSQDKKLNFTQLIKNSKQKRPFEKSLKKLQQQKIIKPAVKQNNTFSKLKNRLINQRQYLDPKPSIQSHPKTIIKPKQEQFDRVRVSMQIQQAYQLNQNSQLDMNPSL